MTVENSQSETRPPGKSSSRAHNYALAPIQTTSSSSFGWTWLVAVMGCAILWPALTVAVINRYTDPTVNFIEALYQRKNIAMASTEDLPGRIVIVGGSDALFGIDAAQLQQALNRPVVNYATHAGLGIVYTLERARRILRQGDTVVLDLAYGMWADGASEFEETEFAYFSSYDKSYYARMGWVRAVRTLYSMPLGDYVSSVGRWWRYHQGTAFHWASVYDISTLSHNGDLRQEIIGSFIQPPKAVPMPAAEPRLTGVERDFAQWARANHIRLLYTWPTFARPADESASRPQVPPWMKTLFDEQSIVQLDQPADNLYPPAWFYDTHKHLNSSARRIHTARLAGRIAEALDIPVTTAKTLFVSASPDAGLMPLADLPDQAVGFRYLENRPVQQDDAIRPQQVKSAVEDGQNVLFDDLNVQPLLALQGLGAKQLLERRANLSEFLRPYDNHLLLVTRNSEAPWPSDATTDLPDALSASLRSSGKFALIVGTGNYATVVRRVGEFERLSGRVSEFTGQSAPRLDVILGPNMLRVNDRDVALAEQGVRVAVVDPRFGTLVDWAAFDAPARAVVVSQQYQIIAGALLDEAQRPVVTALSPQAFTGTGAHLPKVQSTDDNVLITTGGDNSIWGLALHGPGDAPHDGGLTMQVTAPKGTMIRLDVVTNRPELFDWLPHARVIHGDDSPQDVSIRWRLRDGAAFGAKDFAYAAIGLNSGDGPLNVRQMKLINFSRQVP